MDVHIILAMRAHSAFVAICLLVFPMVALADTTDTTPPTIVALVPSATQIWPPDHKMVAVTIDTLVIDDTDPNPSVFITGVTCDDPAFVTGDAQITGPLALSLRAERPGNADRVYTITVEAIDASGNASFGTTTVTVAHTGGRPAPF